MENRLKEILSSIARDGLLFEEAVLTAKERQKILAKPTGCLLYTSIHYEDQVILRI